MEVLQKTQMQECKIKSLIQPRALLWAGFPRRKETKTIKAIHRQTWRQKETEGQAASGLTDWEGRGEVKQVNLYAYSQVKTIKKEQNNKRSEIEKRKFNPNTRQTQMRRATVKWSNQRTRSWFILCGENMIDVSNFRQDWWNNSHKFSFRLDFPIQCSPPNILHGLPSCVCCFKIEKWRGDGFAVFMLAISHTERSTTRLHTVYIFPRWH